MAGVAKNPAFLGPCRHTFQCTLQNSPGPLVSQHPASWPVQTTSGLPAAHAPGLLYHGNQGRADGAGRILHLNSSPRKWFRRTQALGHVLVIQIQSQRKNNSLRESSWKSRCFKTLIWVLCAMQVKPHACLEKHDACMPCSLVSS